MIGMINSFVSKVVDTVKSPFNTVGSKPLARNTKKAVSSTAVTNVSKKAKCKCGKKCKSG